MNRSQQTRGAFAGAILDYVARAGGRARSLRADVGLTQAQSRDPRRAVDMRVIARLLDGAAHVLDDDDVGLHIAERAELGAMGAFSYAVLNAPTLGTALRNIERYSLALVEGVGPALELEGDTAHLVFPFGEGDPRVFRQPAEAAVLLFLRLMRQLGGSEWRPFEVAFRHRAPASTREHQRLLPTRKLSFGQPLDGIRFARSDLELRAADADRFLLPIVERQLEEVVGDTDEPDPLLRELEMLVASCVCDGHPTLQALAPQLGLSVRTLQRRLGAAGVSYRDLVARVRVQIARYYLEETETSLVEIAFLLGYSELSAFDRAFRRWTGRSPSACRAAMPGAAASRRRAGSVFAGRPLSSTASCR